MLSLILLCCVLGVFASNSTVLVSNMTEDDMALVERINNLNTVVDVRFTKEVRDRIHNYVKTYPQGSEKILSRVSIYFPMVENEIRKRNLPEALKYLAVVESALNASAKSKSGAAGLWQFMKGTGKMYGLEVSNLVDERCDALKSTEAAMHYLSDLHSQFDDWTLALAAYNCGPGNVRKAIRKSGGKRNYWEIREFLPSETRHYIPRFIAASYMMEYYYLYDINPKVLHSELSNTATIKVKKGTSFRDLTKLTGVSLEDLKFLNPSYIKGVVPVGHGDNYLTLPASKLDFYFGYTGNYGDVVFQVANNHMSFPDKMRRIRKLNRIPSLDPFETKNGVINDRISIAVTPMRTSLKGYSEATEIRNDFYVYHKLKKRESLFDLIKIYDDVKLEDLIALNNINFDDPPKMGSMVKIKRK